MDEGRIQQLIDLLEQGDRSGVLNLWEVGFALTLSLVCATFIALLYRATHRGAGYSPAFVQTLVLTSLVTTLIMVVIGSNIARAFSLVGALSIIRFRNAIKETRDVGYIFFSLAVAMAAGTRFYSVALLSTGFISAVMFAFHLLGFGAPRGAREATLRIDLPPGADLEELLGAPLRALFESYAVAHVETARGGMVVRATLTVTPKPEVNATQVIEAIAGLNGGLSVWYGQAAHADEL